MILACVVYEEEKEEQEEEVEDETFYIVVFFSSSSFISQARILSQTITLVVCSSITLHDHRCY